MFTRQKLTRKEKILEKRFNNLEVGDLLKFCNSNEEFAYLVIVVRVFENEIEFKDLTYNETVTLPKYQDSLKRLMETSHKSIEFIKRKG